MVTPVKVNRLGGEFEDNRLDISDLQNGLYVISVCNICNERSSMKFVKQ